MKTTIVNRDGNKISLLAEGPDAPGKLVFVMHGLGGTKDQPHIRAMIEAFLASGYTVISWDAVHSFGESVGGDYQDATVTNYYADLEDVIQWSRSQPWYVEPFVLCGHSLGGISVALFAQSHPELVKALAPISTVISGELSLLTKADDIEAWKRDGMRVTMSHDGLREKRLKWSHMEDRMKYDLLVAANKLTMPVLMIVGEYDDATPPQHQRILFDKLPGPKEIHTINGSLHSYYEPHEQAELKDLIETWVAKV